MLWRLSPKVIERSTPSFQRGKRERSLDPRSNRRPEQPRFWSGVGWMRSAMRQSRCKLGKASASISATSAPRSGRSSRGARPTGPSS